MNNLDEKQIEKIKIMAQLAIYDKTFGEDDKKANDLYYRDYIYRKNFNYRLAFSIGYLMIAAFYTLTIFMVPDIDLYNFDFIGFGRDLAIGAGVFLLIATLIGTVASSNDYKKIKYRLKGYFTLMNKLEELDTPKKIKNRKPLAARQKREEFN
ncbi:MAG: hypothetical protein FWF50_07815 [Defluviitaleaceae bacterium]|nr:hypothetical protein [Defluviitaleaceae bacterium]